MNFPRRISGAGSPHLNRELFLYSKFGCEAKPVGDENKKHVSKALKLDS